MKIVIKVAGNRQHGTFFLSVVLDQETKKLTIFNNRNFF